MLFSAMLFSALVQLTSSPPILADLRPIFFEAEKPRALGPLSQETFERIEEQSFDSRARLEEEALNAQRFSLVVGEVLKPSLLLKSAGILWLLVPPEKKPHLQCLCRLRKLKENKWLRRLLIGGLGLWIGLDEGRDAYGMARADFELAWFRAYEAQRRQAEAWGFRGVDRELRLAAALSEAQTQALRQELSKSLPAGYDFLWIPESFSLDHLGSGFVDRTYLLIFDRSGDSNTVLALRLKFDMPKASWFLDHAAISSWESLDPEFSLKPHLISKEFVGELHIPSFWFSF